MIEGVLVRLAARAVVLGRGKEREMEPPDVKALILLAGIFDGALRRTAKIRAALTDAEWDEFMADLLHVLKAHGDDCARTERVLEAGSARAALG